jgi:hypothetical protein
MLVSTAPDAWSYSPAMGAREPPDAEDLAQENENLREQRRAVGEVLRAVARSEGL